MSYTIRDVAARAGVSRATVSRLLSGGYVSSASRELIQSAISELGFRPSVPARMLATKKSCSIGLLVHDFSDVFYAPILRGAAQQASADGYDILLFNNTFREDGDVSHLAKITERRLDGIIAVVHTPSILRHQESLKARVVAVIPNTEDDSVARIEVDNLSGAREAVEHLVSLGHRRIAHIAGPSYAYIAKLREEGYRAAMGAIDAQPKLVPTSGFSKDEGYRAMMQLLTDDDAPSAVFAANDKIALGAWAAARERSLRVPEDLSIVGFDDLDCLMLTDTPLTTVHQPFEEMGAQAVSRLVSVLEGNGASDMVVQLQYRLVVRRSSGPPRKA